MQRRPILGITAMAIVLAIAGCGGGSGSPTPSLPQPGATPISTGPSSGGGSGSQSNARTTATFTVAISSAAQTAVAREQAYRASHGGRTPMFVSPGTQGITITATPNGGAATTYTYDVSSGSALCVVTGGTRSCTMQVAINPGTYAFTMTLYDMAPVSGAIPASAHALGTSTLGSVTIVQGQNNAVAFSVEGIVAGASLSGGSSFLSLPANGSPHSAGLALIVTDASGATISGTYATPISVSLAESGGSGHTQLVLNGTPVGSSASLSSSSDTLALAYDGGGAPGYTTATSFGGVTGSIRMSPLYVSGPLTFSDQNQTKSISISEASSPFTTPPAVSWSCTGFAASTSGSNASASYSVTSPSLVYDAAVPSFACPGTVTITDALGTSITTSESGSLPVATYCASTGGVSNLYLGATDGSGNYEASNGTSCPLAVASPSVTIYAPPNNGTNPLSAAVGVSESRDTTAATVSAPTCSGLATPSPAFLPGTTLSNSLGGNVSISSEDALQAQPSTCTVMVSDENGNVKPVSVNIQPSVQTVNSTVSTGPATCTVKITGVPPNETYTYTCTSKAEEDIGTSAGNGATYSFSNTTNALAVNLTVQNNGTGGGFLALQEISPTPTSWTLTGATSGATTTLDKVYALPNAGVYELHVGVYTGCINRNPCTPFDSITITGYIVESPDNAPGAVAP